MDIAEFLTARYNQEQRYAEAAMKAANERDPLGLPGWASVALRADGSAPTVELSTFVAQWEPARVLADVAAKRRILAAMQAAGKAWAEAQQGARPGPVSFDAARARSLEKELTDVVLRNLAAPYVEHPDHDPAWKVE